MKVKFLFFLLSSPPLSAIQNRIYIYDRNCGKIEMQKKQNSHFQPHREVNKVNNFIYLCLHSILLPSVKGKHYLSSAPLIWYWYSFKKTMSSLGNSQNSLNSKENAAFTISAEHFIESSSKSHKLAVEMPRQNKTMG